jgi:hypothetical protein
MMALLAFALAPLAFDDPPKKGRREENSQFGIIQMEASFIDGTW